MNSVMDILRLALIICGVPVDRREDRLEFKLRVGVRIQLLLPLHALFVPCLALSAQGLLFLIIGNDAGERLFLLCLFLLFCRFLRLRLRLGFRLWRFRRFRLRFLLRQLDLLQFPFFADIVDIGIKDESFQPLQHGYSSLSFLQ